MCCATDCRSPRHCSSERTAKVWRRSWIRGPLPVDFLRPARTISRRNVPRTVGYMSDCPLLDTNTALVKTGPEHAHSGIGPAPLGWSHAAEQGGSCRVWICG